MRSAMAVGIAISLYAAAASAAPPQYEQLLAASCADRLATNKQATHEEKETFLNSLTDRQLIELGKRSLCVLGDTYRFQLMKQERVGRSLLDPQTVTATVRESPFAVRMEVLQGPNKGMKVLYNTQLRTDKLRARKAGLLSLLAVWVDIHGGLAHEDTNHDVTDLGVGGVLRNLEKQLPRSDAAGVKRVPAGWDAAGRYCVDFVAPPGAKDVYAQKTHLCLDTEIGLPMSALSTDERGGVIETIEFSHLEMGVKVADDFFTLAAASL